MIIRVGEYLLSLILIVFYLSMFIIGLKPTQVSESYRMYYIDKEVDVYREDFDFNYTLNKQINFTNSNNTSLSYVTKGWNNSEDDGTWTKDKSTLILDINDEIDTKRILIKFNIVDWAQKEAFNVIVNNQKVGNIVYDVDSNNYEMEIPAGVFTKGRNEIELMIPFARRASEIDSRTIGIRVQYIVIEEL